MPRKNIAPVYARQDVLRLLGITERKLRSWERSSLVPRQQSYSYADLQDLHVFRDLLINRSSRRWLLRALKAMRKRDRFSEHPLWRARFRPGTKRITVKMAGTLFEPVSGQLLLDFDSAPLQFPASLEEMPRNEGMKRRNEAESWFQIGVEREQNGAPFREVLEAYEKAIELNPSLAAALVNLGTLHFQMQGWSQAERCYQRAVAVTPDYPLAHFNLANLYDELGDRAAAQRHYEIALELNPTYADAHYNIALLYQATNNLMRAAMHWQAYLKIDPSSSWSTIARRQLRLLAKSAIVPGSGKSPTRTGVS